MQNYKDLFSASVNSEKSLSANNSQDQFALEKKTSEHFDIKHTGDSYSAHDIEVLEGLEPVRRRPGMFIGGTDSGAMHHLFAEVLDNSMDEAVAGHATWIQVKLESEGFLSVSDNGRGIPVDPHPKFPCKSALEVIMTTLHAGGKFDSTVYETSGGLHGVGISVVNALSDTLEVEVARDQQLYKQIFSQGVAQEPLQNIGRIKGRRGTKIRFRPDREIFGEHSSFIPLKLYEMACAKAYLFGGVEIRWNCSPELVKDSDLIPVNAVFHFPGGLQDYLQKSVNHEDCVTNGVFTGKTKKAGRHGAVEWAITWHTNDGFVKSYCNTIPTIHGGSHEAGMRIALTKSLKQYGELLGNKKYTLITTEDVMASAVALLSVFIREPEFVGQTKEKLATAEAQKIVESAIRDQFDHWLASSPKQATQLLEWVIARSEERLRRRKEKEINRKTATRRLRLPGKLVDCSKSAAGGTELFIVEGDSAGGSAKQARNRKNQAVLPLRGKILNVASAGRDKLLANQQIADLLQAIGCETGARYRRDDLRYDRIIIMTDADVDGAHIASLLVTFFYKELPELIRFGHLYLAVPPLYRLSQGGKILYARDENHKNQLIKTRFTSNKKIEISRFKGLGEMMPAQLKETTMDPEKRVIVQVCISEKDESITMQTVDQLMGNNPQTRFQFIQDNARFIESVNF